MKNSADVLTEYEIRCLQYLSERPTTVEDGELKLTHFHNICGSFKEINNVSLASDAINSLIEKGLIARCKMEIDSWDPIAFFYTLTLKGKNLMRQSEGKDGRLR